MKNLIYYSRIIYIVMGLFVIGNLSFSQNYNILDGYDCGYPEITTGSYNNLQGYQCGYTMQIGNYNNLRGYRSGYNSQMSNGNNITGYYSARLSIMTSYNSLNGAYSGYNTHMTQQNTLIGGYNTGANASLTMANTLLGSYSGRYSDMISYNTLIGYAAGGPTYPWSSSGSTLGSSNIAIGTYSLSGSTVGDNTISFGAYAGRYSTSDNDIFIGTNAGDGNDGGNNIFIGKYAGSSGSLSNKLRIGNTTSGGQSLIEGDFSAKTFSVNGKSYFSNCIGVGTTNPQYGKIQIEGDGVTEGIAFWKSGSSTSRMWTNVANNTFHITRGIDPLNGITINSNGKVGIGTDNPLTKLHISDGTVTKSWASNVNGRTVAMFEGDDTNGAVVSIIGKPTGYSGIFLGTSACEAYGQIIYRHSDHQMRFGVGQTNDDLIINRLGYVGIGTDPNAKLHVVCSNDISGNVLGNSTFLVGLTTNGIGFDDNEIVKKGGDIKLKSHDGHLVLMADQSLNKTVSIGTLYENANLGTGSRLNFGGIALNGDPMEIYKYSVATEESHLRIRVGDGADEKDKFVVGTEDNSGVWTNSLVVTANGKVAINKDVDATLNYQLDIDGSIRAKEIKVEDFNTGSLNVEGNIFADQIKVKANGNTADFVFEDNYQLKDLNEVETFIQENNHLPDVPSAQAMEENGVDLAEMNKILLQKVEELTLYMIQQKKEIEELKAKVNK